MVSDLCALKVPHNFFTFIPMEKVVLNYARFLGTCPSYKCDLTVCGCFSRPRYSVEETFFIHPESLLLFELECWLAVVVCKFQIIPYLPDVSSSFVVVSGN